MKLLVTYQSKTGFTQKYAEWIAQELTADLKPIAKVREAEVAGYDLIVHGGWIMGGVVSGLDKIKSYHPAKLVVFGVGYTQQGEINLPKILADNQLSDIPFYYYRGGTHPKKMGFMDRAIFIMVTKNTPEYEDFTDQAAIGELISAVKETAQ